MKPALYIAICLLSLLHEPVLYTASYDMCACLSDAQKINGMLQNTPRASVLAHLVLPSQGLAELLETSYAKHVTDNNRGSPV